MKTLFLLFSLHVSFNSFAQNSEPEYAIYFGNNFRNDSVTITVNGIRIAQNIKLKSTMIDPQNLTIIQDARGITVTPHYEQKQTFKNIPIKNATLNLNMAMNNVVSGFRIDLREGKYLYPEYIFFRIGWSSVRVLTITQSQQGPLML